MTEIDPETLQRLRDLAQVGDTPLAEQSMEVIARRLGMTRMTLYRRAGSRQNIIAALAAMGIDAAGEPLARERVIEATGELLRERSLAEVTLEAIADRARCSLPALYAQFGNRQGVLKATFEQYSPLPVVERLFLSGEMSADATLRSDVRTLYGAIFDQVTPAWPVLRAFIAEVLRDVDSEVGVLFREWYLPRAMAAISPTLQRHAQRGSFRPLPALLIMQAFVGPMMLHVATRGSLQNDPGVKDLDRDSTIDFLTDMFCRAVGADESEGPSTAA